MIHARHLKMKLQTIEPATVVVTMLTAASALLWGCSSEKTPPTLPGAHPAAWMDTESEDFHGEFVLADNTASCAHCHGIDEPGGRVGISCTDCHGPGSEGCRSCHGGLDNGTGAPPYGLRGETAVTSRAVGAHTTHLDTTSLGAPVPCEACHVVPTYLLSPPHLDQDRPEGEPLDSIAEVVWGGIADGGNANWDRNACSGTYCHGNFAGGDTGNTPVWTGTNQATCGSCHDVGIDPESLSGRHKKHITDEGLDCIECHSTVVNRRLVIVNTSVHVDGRKTVSLLTSGTYQNGSCSGLPAAACHSTENWYDTR